jgi:hypothetical protein
MTPFEVRFGYIPQSPLNLAYGKEKCKEIFSRIEDGKYENLCERIRKVHHQFQEMLQKTQEKYNNKHEEHSKEQKIQVGGTLVDPGGYQWPPTYSNWLTYICPLGSFSFHLDSFF